MQKLSLLLLLASLLSGHVVLPASALQPPEGAENAQNALLLPPHVERVSTPATRLYVGMMEGDVERTMGTATEVMAS